MSKCKWGYIYIYIYIFIYIYIYIYAFSHIYSSFECFCHHALRVGLGYLKFILHAIGHLLLIDHQLQKGV